MIGNKQTKDRNQIQLKSYSVFRIRINNPISDLSAVLRFRSMIFRVPFLLDYPNVPAFYRTFKIIRFRDGINTYCYLLLLAYEIAKS